MMNEDRDRDDESVGDFWLTNWEQQCIQHLENEPDYEGQVINDRDLATQKAWCCFQNSATAIAQLYKDRLQDVPTLWVPFQTAAGSVATLYKDATEAIKRQGELGTQCGYQRRNKELLNWARKKRRHIRREELISYLAGKPLPPRTTCSHHAHHRMSPLPRLVVSSHSGNSHQGMVQDSAAASMDNILHML
ncbi:HUWE1-associated protein modifying stress responses-like [Macrosteles quadrilineatus]|uniref:HUWE1-associated protein modifying stress responses-like n=1 Tax=Macrosteles quadrilineatus TaxID=74068 RepID=UPI0023E24296|nr:HUWE1-associated protein modifying stress responses-like [Macrosteles quadrilineatus]